MIGTEFTFPAEAFEGIRVITNKDTLALKWATFKLGVKDQEPKG